MFTPQEEKAWVGAGSRGCGMVYIKGALGGHDKHWPFIVEVCKDSAGEKLVKGHKLSSEPKAEDSGFRNQLLGS